MWDTYLFSGRWYGKISAAESYQGGSDIARNIANNSLVVSHASPYLHVAIIAQSQRIGSGQTWFFGGLMQEGWQANQIAGTGVGV